MGRHKTYFGVTMPPWKEEKLGAGAMTIRFVIKGRVVSKKNHQQAVSRRKEAKNFLYDRLRQAGSVTMQDALAAVDMVQAKMIGNTEYRDFLKEFKPVIQEQMKVWEDRLGSKGVRFPLHKAVLSLRFYFADRYITDTVNKQQSIQDLLVDCGVVSNDDYRVLNPITGESRSYFNEIKENICFISLSFKVDKAKNQERRNEK